MIYIKATELLARHSPELLRPLSGARAREQAQNRERFFRRVRATTTSGRQILVREKSGMHEREHYEEPIQDNLTM